jgi:crotonobetainyl-CoA:carnitine CoA-transferase CaiB-like acyl-CoA transferase
MPGAPADIGGGGLMAVVGLLAALVGRAATGEESYVDVSMLDGTLGLLPRWPRTRSLASLSRSQTGFISARCWAQHL